ncbi:MAG TPA: biliverdin-producing heme oxygenase [Gemmatimonadales bacterium]|nr:biliverdin-producing heme oxygenase [Gemmatimonadales bacterium]
MNTDVAGTMLTLRESTSTHHRRAEQHEFQQQLVRGTLPPALYARWLAQMLHVHAALEAHLDRLVTRTPRLKTVYDEGRAKAPALRHDLAYLQAGADTPPLPAARAMMAEMDRLAEENPLALLGILYVLEGSTNGSKFIARRVRPAYQLPASGEGAEYLDPYGDLQPARWQEFKAAVDALDLPAADVEPLVLAAQRTFDSIRELGAELLESAAS